MGRLCRSGAPLWAWADTGVEAIRLVPLSKRSPSEPTIAASDVSGIRLNQDVPDQRRALDGAFSGLYAGHRDALVMHAVSA